MDKLLRHKIKEFQWKNDLDVENAKALMFKVADELEKDGITFWLAFGTALGAKREGSFIPHDIDLDIGLRYEDVCRAKRAMKRVPIFHLRDIGDIATYSHKNVPIDLYFFKEKSDGRLWSHDQYWIHKYEIESFDRVELVGREFNVPRYVDKYLIRLYGEDWMIPQRNKHAQQ